MYNQYSFVESRLLPVETAPHPTRLVSGTSKFTSHFLSLRLQLNTPTDTWSELQQLLIYIFVWKSVAT